ncbi:MAG: response regulator, partial [Cyanobacteria bacterium REEB65]|nr:response regulator [Cyanobacteria bacterium REEB65]
MTDRRHSGPSRILAIDDHPDNLALYEAILADSEVRLAPDGPSGLALATTDPPELILLDVQMPGMDGFQTLEALRAHPKTAEVPVILITASMRDSHDIERGLALGAVEYLTKPIKPDELKVRIRAVLRATRAERELERLRADFAAMLL